MSFSTRRELVAGVDAAKRPEPRTRRIEKVVAAARCSTGRSARILLLLQHIRTRTRCPRGGPDTRVLVGN
ncbi:YdeI/OmpD-associated family protein [Nocardia pseudovaccinii]|uniref:YdeI/OmpD-associated family protein n=1 Tax=Nocardia pseudovaccinii TaxID=189540 RepID=UPI003D936355